MKLEHYLQKLEAIDQKIRMKATGNKEDFAESLNISKATLHRYLDFMKSMEAPIAYDWLNETYHYTRPIKFEFSIEFKEIDIENKKSMYGGVHVFRNENFSNLFSLSSKNELTPTYLSIVR